MTRVYLIGPSQNNAGGIGSVIRTYVQEWIDENYSFSPLVSYVQGQRFKTLLNTVRIFLKLFKERHQEESIAHVHLSQGGSFLREGAICAFSKFIGLRVVSTIHGSGFPIFAKRNSRLARFALANSDQILCLTDEAMEIIEGFGFSRKCQKVGNPIQIPKTLAQDLSVTPSAFFAGEIGFRKGVDILLEAWPKVASAFPQSKLLLAGPTTRKFIQYMSRADIPQSISFLGPLSQEAVADQIEKSWLCVLPSRAEALPKFLLEAMASSRTVISSNVGSIPDLVPPDVGVVLGTDDPAIWAEEIKKLFQDRDATQEMGKNARRFVTMRYESSLHFKAVEVVYEKALSRSA